MLGGFTGKLAAFEAEFYAFGVGAVADFAELVLPRYATDYAVGAGAFLHSGAFLASNSANTNPHVNPVSTCERKL